MDICASNLHELMVYYKANVTVTEPEAQKIAINIIDQEDSEISSHIWHEEQENILLHPALDKLLNENKPLK